jgi:hypothetical protein
MRSDETSQQFPSQDVFGDDGPAALTQATQMTKTLQEKIIEANDRGSRFLADANEAAEQGKPEKADRLYQKSQFWLDRYNKLAGNS